ncbi:MAG TPA: zf-HC2 domain-containing protein [Pyrinomonadaceae bacterium]|nr:zf-HC2 domain-containing protein [Pyrinomonadaceae bacterium]
MKCDDCQNLLAEYIDGEVIESDAEQISAHLITCAGCAKEFELVTAEQELFARYDRELEITPAMWSAVSARTAVENKPVDSGSKINPLGWLAGLFAPARFGFAFSGALAVLIAAVVIGVMYLRTQPLPKTPRDVVATTPGSLPPPPIFESAGPPAKGTEEQNVKAQYVAGAKNPARLNPSILKASTTIDQNDVLFSDASDIEDKDTAEHVQQAQNLLKSIRNLQLGDSDDEIDVTYEKTTSRRLLDENVVLRRDAEMAGKFPAKTLLSSLEPFLLDIANLPDKTTPGELRQIKDRVQKTEIVAALQSY